MTKKNRTSLLGLKREFGLGDLLCIVTGRLVSRRGIEAVYDVMKFLLGQPIWTHQIGKYLPMCKEDLLRQHPQLAAVELEWDEPYPQGKKSKIIHAELGTHNWKQWLERQEAKFGKALVLEPMKIGPWVNDPIGDLVGMVGSDKVVVVETGDAPKHSRN